MALSQDNLEKVRKAVGEAGDRLKDKMLPLPEIPNRNSYAHLWREIKHSFGKSYKECEDDDVPRMLEIVAKAEVDALAEFDSAQQPI